MDSNKVKGIIIILALGGAVSLWLWWRSHSGIIAGMDSVPAGETVWVKCSNPACGASYEMNLKEYYKEVGKKVSYMRVPPIKCKKCGKESLFRAIKCKKCGYVFFPYEGSATIRNKCPKCGFIQTGSPQQE